VEVWGEAEEEEYVCCWVDGVSVGKGRGGKYFIRLLCLCIAVELFAGVFVRVCVYPCLKSRWELHFG
jgi:hypothetical protein